MGLLVLHGWQSDARGHGRGPRRDERAGLGGAVYLEVGIGIEPGPIEFMSEPWQTLLGHAFETADRLGLQMALAAGPGWCGTGGPWVTPGPSMQHLVASKTLVQGPTGVQRCFAPASAAHALLRRGDPDSRAAENVAGVLPRRVCARFSHSGGGCLNCRYRREGALHQGLLLLADSRPLHHAPVGTPLSAERAPAIRF